LGAAQPRKRQAWEDRPRSAADLAAHKSLLVAQADLARTELLLAWTELRDTLAPPATPDRSARARGTAALLVAVAMPFLGRSRFGRLLRITSLGLAAWRAIARWRAG
jgi:hypothetical protein